jgi:UDPglucose 6-dehydrogenase
MNLAIVGSGYVGLVAGACFAELGNQVVLVDNDAEKLAALQRGEVPIHEDFLPQLLERHRGKNLTFSGDLASAVRSSSVIFIAVGTPPTAEGEADMSYVESVAREIARATEDYKVVVEKSTVPVFTNDWIRRIMLLEGCRLESFDIASNPEFLREGTAVLDFLYPDRIVVGADQQRSSKLLAELYKPLTDGTYAKSPSALPRPASAAALPKLVLTTAKSAELIKHASNAYLAMKISFINAVASICESVGANVQDVCAGIGSDSRIGNRFLNPGIGYGGSCFPKDLQAFRSVAREAGYDFRLLDEVIRVNNEQRSRFLKKIRSTLWNLKGKKLAVLGLAFKGGTDDIRESPAIAIIESLLKEGSEVIAYDPAAISRAESVLTGNVRFASSAYDAATDCDALLILTEWQEFAQLDLPRIKSALRYPVIIDGRNLYKPADMLAAGFNYVSIGRPDVHATPARAQSAPVS